MRYGADWLIEALSVAAPESNELGMAWTYRGSALFELRRYAEAREAHLQALAISEGPAQAAPEDVAVTLNNVGTTYHVERASADAERFYRRALDLFVSHAPDHPMRLRSMANLAMLLKATDRADEGAHLERDMQALS